MASNWEARYKEYKDIWGFKPEYTISQYQSLVSSGPVLDIGIGEGRNVIGFALKGNTIEGIDISETAVNRAKERLVKLGSSFDLSCDDIRSYDYKEDYYSFIISTWTLNFLKRSELINLITKVKNAVKDNGMIYIAMFSKADPKYISYKDTLEEVEKDTFYIPERNTYVNYIDKEELVSYFGDEFEIITLKEDYSLEIGHGDEHYHGAFEMIARKL